jgi:uncharacterized membrane protein
MTNNSVTNSLINTEAAWLEELRRLRRATRIESDVAPSADVELTPGQRIADQVAATMGSWPFIITQSTILLGWIILNIVVWMNHWDPYPFILLNLALSFQAAYAAPFIMMSQNRQQNIDRLAAESDYQINVKAELEIETLHAKIDEMRETEVRVLAKAVADLVALLKAQSGQPN